MYKMEKDKSRKSGNGTVKKQWKYFSKIDSIMSEKHIVSPPSIVDVMADTSQGNLKDTGKFFSRLRISAINHFIVTLLVFVVNTVNLMHVFFF